MGKENIKASQQESPFGNNHNDCMYCYKLPGVVDENGEVQIAERYMCFHRSKWFLQNPVDKECTFPGARVKDCPHYTARKTVAPDDGVNLKLPVVKAIKGTGFIDR